MKILDGSIAAMDLTDQASIQAMVKKKQLLDKFRSGGVVLHLNWKGEQHD